MNIISYEPPHYSTLSHNIPHLFSFLTPLPEHTTIYSASWIDESNLHTSLPATRPQHRAFQLLYYGLNYADLFLYT